MKIGLTDGRVVTLKEPLLKDAIKFNNKSFIGAIIEIIGLVTNLSETEILSLSLQDAIFCLASFRLLVWSNVPIYRDDAKDEDVYPVELIDDEQSMEKLHRDEYFIIDENVFFSYLPMSECLVGEDYASKNGLYSDFALILASCGHRQGFLKGWEVLKNATSNPIIQGSYQSLLNGITRAGFINLNIEKTPVTLLTNVQEIDGKKIVKELPFRTSLLFHV